MVRDMNLLHKQHKSAPIAAKIEPLPWCHLTLTPNSPTGGSSKTAKHLGCQLSPHVVLPFNCSTRQALSRRPG